MEVKINLQLTLYFPLFKKIRSEQTVTYLGTSTIINLNMWYAIKEENTHQNRFELTENIENKEGNMDRKKSLSAPFEISAFLPKNYAHFKWTDESTYE